MIALAVEEEIRRLLGEGELPQRAIARKLGISRGTVGAIARGKRPDYTRRSRQETRDSVFVDGPVRRCLTCGARVKMPCLACRVRAWKERRK